jgi:beta-glucosidase
LVKYRADLMPSLPEVPFPSEFLWGAATSSYQIEGAAHRGGRGPSIWDDFCDVPGQIAGGETGEIACGHYDRIDEDVKTMVDLGLRSYRFSISWSRVMPQGRGRTNPEGLAFYHRLVDRLVENNIVPCATLFHWDLPSGLEEIGGFRNRDTASWFSDYAALMVAELGDRVTMWATLNEPWCHAYLGHAAGVHAPGLTDDRAAVSVAHHQMLAHGLGVQAMRAERNGLELGLVLNPTNVVATGTPPPPEDSIRRIDAIHNRWWFDSAIKGVYPADIIDDLGFLAESIRSGDNDEICQKLDWIGVNYYSDLIVRHDTVDPDGASDALRTYPTVTDVAAVKPDAIRTDMGWPVTPDGLTEILLRLRDEYPDLPPIYITENGCAYDDPVRNGRCVDTRRIDYLDHHLRALAEAIHDGVDIRGYFQWSLMDNFEWAHGFDMRFGLVHVDYATLARTPRDSAYWYRDVIKANALPERSS